MALLTTVSGCVGMGETAGSTHVGRQNGDLVKPLEFYPPTGLAKVNKSRQAHGLNGLVADSRLQRAAQAHADLMAATGNYGHEFGPGTRFPVRIAAVGFEGSAGENIGVGYGSVEAAIQGWLDSPKHRKIMLRGAFDRAGIAYAFNRSGKNPRYTHFWVLIVGREGNAPRMRPV